MSDWQIRLLIGLLAVFAFFAVALFTGILRRHPPDDEKK